MSDVMYVTKETLDQMKAELQRMKTVDRPGRQRRLQRQGKKVI